VQREKKLIEAWEAPAACVEREPHASAA
jgi:hypothetical protein